MSDNTEQTAPATPGTSNQDMEVETAQIAKFAGARIAVPGDYQRAKETVAVNPFSHEVLDGDSNPEEYGDVNQKYNCMLYMLVMCKHIMTHCFKCFDYDIRISNDAASMFRTIHNYLRKKNGVLPNVPQLTDADKNQGIATNNTVISCGYVFNVDTHAMAKTMISTASHFGLNYKANRKDAKNWFATMAPIVAYLSTFKNRVDELRLGTVSFTVKKKKDGKDEKATIMSFGFKEMHAALATGISYPPEIRSSMTKATGPVTQLIGLLTNNKKPYCEKYIRTLKETFKFIKGNENIWKVLASKPNSAAAESIVRNLADIALMCTARHHHKASPPVCMLFPLIPEVVAKHYFADLGTDKHVFPNIASPPFEDQFGLKKFDFSGKGLFFYFGWFDAPVVMPKMDPSLAREILFHGIFGTQFEELSILSEMTGYNQWHNRAELGKCFEKMGSKVETVAVVPIRPILGSRMRKAILTKMTPQSATQVVATPVFSGMQTHKLLKMFIDLLENELGSIVGSSEDIDVINREVASLRSNTIDQLRTQKEITYGTAKWFKISGRWEIPDEEHMPYEPERVLVGKNLYFNKIAATQMDEYEYNEDECSKAKKRRLEAIKGL